MDTRETELEAVRKRLSDASSHDLDTMIAGLLEESYNFCSVYAPGQLVEVSKAIANCNKHLARASSPDEMMKLASALKSLQATYAQLLEQSTVVFMSTYKPLSALVQADVGTVPENDSEPVAVTDKTIDSSEIVYSNYSDD